MLKNNNVIYNIKLATLAQVVVLICSVFRTLFIPKVIPVNEFGNYQIYLLYLSYISIFMLGFNDGIYLRYSKLSEKDIREKKFNSTIIIFFIFLVIESIILIFLSTYFFSNEKKVIMYLVIINIPITGIYGSMIYYLQINNKFKKYSLATITEKLMFILGFFIVCSIRNVNFYYFIILDIFSKALIVIYLISTEYKNFESKGFSIKKGIYEFYKNIKVGWKIMIGIYLSILFSGICRIFIENRSEISVFSYYSLANSMTSIIVVFIATLGVAIFPFLVKQNDEKYGMYFEKMNTIMNKSVPLLLLSYFIANIIIKIFLPLYINSLDYLNILYIIVVLQAKIQVINNTYYRLLRKEMKMMKDNFISVILLIFGCLLLKNIKVILFWQIIVLIHRSISSQMFFGKSMHLKNTINSIKDIIIIIVFYLCTVIEFEYGIIIYSLICVAIIIKNFNFYTKYLKLFLNKKRSNLL